MSNSSGGSAGENSNVVGMPEGDWSLDIGDLVLEDEPFAKGAFGKVYKADYLGTPVCVKMISKQLQEDDLSKFTIREVAALKSLSHPNLVQFIGAGEADRCIYLVTEFVPGGTVRKRLKNMKDDVPWQHRINIAFDVASAMAFLHARHIIHRDLKSKNLLLMDNWKVKLCDFGFARSIKDRRQMRHMTLCGTEEYMAPEVIFGMDYDQRAEVYSFGLLMCELITRQKIEETVPRTPATSFGLDLEAYKAIVPHDCPAGFLDVALKCAAFEPDNRPEFREVTKLLRIVKDDYSNSLVKIANLERKLTESFSTGSPPISSPLSLKKVPPPVPSRVGRPNLSSSLSLSDSDLSPVTSPNIRPLPTIDTSKKAASPAIRDRTHTSPSSTS